MGYFPLETSRLLLRAIELSDAEEIFGFHGLEEVVRYCPFEPRSREEVDGRMARWMAMDGTPDSEGVRYAMILKSSGEMVGDCSLSFTDKPARQGVLGYLSHPRFFGNGYVTEAVSAVMRVGFEVGKLHRISAHCDARNTGSWRVMEKLGMRREAHFREHAIFKGEWDEEFVYAILEDEWRAARKAN